MFVFTAIARNIKRETTFCIVVISRPFVWENSLMSCTAGAAKGFVPDRNERRAGEKLHRTHVWGYMWVSGRAPCSSLYYLFPIWAVVQLHWCQHCGFYPRRSQYSRLPWLCAFSAHLLDTPTFRDHRPPSRFIKRNIAWRFCFLEMDSSLSSHCFLKNPGHWISDGFADLSPQTPPSLTSL